MVEKISIERENEFGVISKRDIKKDELVFSHNDWIQDEKEGWHILTIDQLNDLSDENRHKFLRYGYDIDFGKIIGTFDWHYAKHKSNFLNHSCKPNLIYDYHDNIITARDIKKGEELTLDYGHFIVNVDQEFICNCSNDNCRKNILKNDWKNMIVEMGYHFPVFMHNRINKLITLSIKIRRNK
jgi:SET domain-containing protein